jgi:hypothetical protein
MGKDITVVTCFHQRAWLSQLWLEHTSPLTKIVASVSDPENARLCKEFGVEHVWTENKPLGQKWNTAWGLAKGRKMILGSDDFVNPVYLDACRASDASYIMPGSCGFYEHSTGKACVMRWDGSNTMLYGTGRVYDGDDPLWTPSRNRGLDQDSHCRIIARGHTAERLEVPGVCAVDVKTGLNLWGFGQVAHRASQVPGSLVLGHVAPSLVARLVR